MRTYLLESKYELFKALRLPAYSLPTILFPVVFYVFFGVMFGGRSVGSVKMAEYLIATYGAFGVIGASLFGFGVSVAIERGQGWLEAKRTTPMPVSAYFFAKTVMAMTFSSAIIVLLFTMGTLFSGVQLAPMRALALFGVLVSGSITFCALGLCVAFIAGPNSAAPIVNLIYLPMAFLSGLWIPVQMLPKAVQKIALWLPPYHYSQLALKVIGADRGGSALVHVAAMVAFTVLFTALAYIGYRRDEGKMYG
ncbi:MAG: ABC transporter permease [Acidobacteria bacterium]|nr:ABC transporter permease [Acidobacteriota bacterium]MBV9477774.1 ABC transporter permease [Acidobacteriota bacterium]